MTEVLNYAIYIVGLHAIVLLVMKMSENCFLFLLRLLNEIFITLYTPDAEFMYASVTYVLLHICSIMCCLIM